MISVVFHFTEQFPELHGLEQQLHRLETALKVDKNVMMTCYDIIVIRVGIC